MSQSPRARAPGHAAPTRAPTAAGTWIARGALAAISAGAGLLCAAALGWYPRHAPAPPTVTFADGHEARTELFEAPPANALPKSASHSLNAGAHSRARGSSTPPAELFESGPRPWLALHPDLLPTEVNVFFPGGRLRGMRAVDLGYVARAPNVRLPFVFPDHPAGGFEVVTDALGLRRDQPLPGRTIPRVLVLGDSHMDGVLENRENMCHRIETALAQRGTPAAVLNASVGGTTFVNHLGALVRLRELSPALIVVVVYGGNDFYEQVLLERYVRGMPEPTSTQQALRRVLDSKRDGHAGRSGFVSQELQQALYFDANPGDEALAVAAAVETLWAAQQTAEAMGATFLAVYLPTATAVEPSTFAARVNECLELAEGAPTALLATERLKRGLLEGLGRAGVDFIDLFDTLANSGEACYWPSDLHLSIVGHRHAATALETAVAQRLAAGPR